MSCKLQYKDNIVIGAFAPNGNNSKLFDNINKLPGMTSEVALKYYAQVYTPQFKDWFGDWETLAEIKRIAKDKLSFKNETTGTFNDTDNKVNKNVYLDAFLSDPEQGAFEIATQANSNIDSLTQVEMTYGATLVDLALKLFPNAQVGDTYIPTISKALDENNEPLLLFSGRKDKNTLELTPNIPDPGLSGSQTPAIFFTNDYHIATSYASIRDDNTDEVLDRGLVIPAFLNIKKPYRSDTIDITIPEGDYDGSINIETINHYEEYMILRPDQAKHLFNKGTFSSSSNNTFFSAPNYDTSNKVKAEPRLAQVLSTPKFQTLYKRFYFQNPEKFYRELIQEVGKQQAEILREYDIRNRPQSLEEMIAGILAEISYTVEIEIAQEKIKDREDSAGVSPYEIEGSYYIADPSEGEINKITKEQFDEYHNKTNIYIPTQHYINVSVPGGVNYRENEIRTPDITPSIRGHAAFATDQGIGWFRSDDRAIEVRKINTGPAAEAFGLEGVEVVDKYIASKTRRILELQSDLFQKGRDNKTLIGDTIYSAFGEEVFKNSGKGKEVVSTHNTFLEAYNEAERLNQEERENVAKRSENQFLQLLNKDNNWVTFFVKSIIQDSAKKGYEKVLFPTGDTAAKVEGHETLQEYIDNRVSAIEQISKDLSEIDTVKKFKSGWFIYEEKKSLIGGTTYTMDGTTITKTQYEESRVSAKKALEVRLEQFNKELTDAREGRQSFITISKFYEQDIHNILIKKGYAPIRIKDEHENEWYEVEVNQQRDTETIYYQQPDSLISSKAAPITLAQVRKFLHTIGMSEESITEVTQIYHEGRPIGAYAMADTLHKTIQIAQGKENVTLPEEAMHFLVALIKVNRPQLYDSLISKVRDYALYKRIINSPSYIDDPNYRTRTGALDINKIKEEAVAKVLAEYLIEELEGGTEKPELLIRAKSWWSEILQWIKSLFSRYADPFEGVITDVATDQFASYGNINNVNYNGIFLSAAESLASIEGDFQSDFASTQDRNETPVELESNRALFTRLKNRTKELNITKIDQKYFKDGVEGRRRVSDLVEDYYADLFRNKQIPEEMKPFYEQTRQDGTYIHEIIEDVLRRLINTETGIVRPEPLPINDNLIANPIARSGYDYIAKNIVERISQYPEGTRFLFEHIVYDNVREMFGTIDFIAIEPNNKLHILDWKTLYYEEYNKNSGVKEFKEEAFNIQIREYRRILRDNYEVSNFGQLRAIPIKKVYVQVKDAQGIPTGERKLIRIQMGSGASRSMLDDSLRPVIVREETTGNKKLDSFINILYKIGEDLKTKRKGLKFDSGKYELIKSSIYELRTEQDIQSLYKYSIIELTTIKKLLEDIEKNKANYTNENINDILADLNYYYSLLGSLEKVAFLSRTEIVPKESTAKLNKLVASYENAKESIAEVRQELTDKVSRSYGIFNLLKPEKVMHFWSKYMRTMSQAQTAAVQTLYKMASKVFNRISLQNTDENRKLQIARAGVSNWATRNGITSDKALEKLLKFNSKGEWNGNMISTVDSDFYAQRTAVLKSGQKQTILQWWEDNYDTATYVQWYQQESERYKEEVASSTYSEDEEVNKSTKAYLIDTFEKRYNIVKHPTTAIGPHNRQAWSKNIKVEKWYSDEYKFLLRPENAELLQAYNLFTSINKELVDLGVIEAWRENTFIPNIRKSFADTLGFQEGNLITKSGAAVSNWFNDGLESIKVRDQELNYSGYINPITGEKENKIFAAYVAEIGEWVADPTNKTSGVKLSYSKKSADLFTVYSLMNRQKLRYKYLSEVENIAQGLKHVEAEKGAIETNKFGRIQRDKQGNIKISEANNENANIFDKHMRAVIYGEVIQNDADMFVEVTRNKFAKAWNKSLFGNITKMKETKDKPSKISATKVLMKLNNANQLRVLGVNLGTAISNLFGGVASTYLINKQYFTDSDLTNAATQMVSGQWYATEDMKKRAALVDYFLPLLDNRDNFKSKQLSTSRAVRILSQEWLMAAQRKTDHIVQLNIFLATLENTMVENGELVNIRKYIQDKNNWNTRYDISASERKSLELKIEKEITALKKERNIVKISTFKKVKIGGKEETVVEIPGINRNADTVEQFREIIQNLSKNVLGASNEFDLAAYKYNIWGRLFMTFKNWIPRQLDVRMGEFRYDTGHDSFEWGRARMFFRAFGSHWMQSFLKLTPFLGRVVSKYENKDYLIDKAKQLYDEKQRAFKELGLYSEDQFIKEDEFIQMFMQGVDAEFTEFRTITVLLAIFLGAVLEPSDDDDDETKNVKKRLMRQLDKLTDELSFFYSPQSFIDVMGSKPLPVIGLVGDYYKLVKETGKEFFGATFNIKDGKWEDEAKPQKYLFKAFPITKELLGYIPIIDPEMAKEMGIKLQTANRN